MNDTVRTAIIAGIVALISAMGGAYCTGRNQQALAEQQYNAQLELAKQSFNSDLVKKALESNSPDDRLASLTLFSKLNLIKDKEVRDAILAYVENKNKPVTDPDHDPVPVPQVVPDIKLAAPIVSNARVYLLGGNTNKEPLFPKYTSDLEAAGYKVLSHKIITGSDRPTEPEVCYFYAADENQAKKIAEFVKFKLGVNKLDAWLLSDPSVNPGYIEIWFGK